MVAEFPKEWKREGKFLKEPHDIEIPDPTQGQELSERIPEPKGTGYLVYEFLQRNGYWMTPGLRFGCDFTAYPGDPLRFHSHFMVHVEKKEEQVEMLTLVGGGRVATQTRKAWMLAGVVDQEVRIFSIEWAGFG
jgi:tRNA-splicing endonuclease subunit Sen34